MVVEGEVKRPVVYKLEVNETLQSVLQRAGGLTPNAYVYGSQLMRESARIEQQNSLDQLVNTMEVQVRQSALSIAASAGGGDAQGLAQLQEGIVSQLRAVKASGRVALPVKPSDKNLTDLPDMVMEDNDRLIIPHRPSTVSVVGNVYNPGSFIYESHTNSGAYLDMAGKGKPQSDLKHAFVLRANGVVVAANNVNGPFNFVGPDGTAATFFANGASLADFNGYRYLKYSVALVAFFDIETKSFSRQIAMPGATLAISVSRDAKNEVSIMSNETPRRPHSSRSAGMSWSSMNP